MIARNIGVVLVRLFCVYLAITAIQALAFVIPTFVEFGYRGGDIQDLLTSASLWLMLTSILLPAICAFWLWRNADFVIPEDMVDDGASATASEIMLIGVSLLGLYLLVWGLIGLVRVQRTSEWLPVLAQIVIAIPLLLGRRRLAALLLKAKRAGIQ